MNRSLKNVVLGLLVAVPTLANVAQATGLSDLQSSGCTLGRWTADWNSAKTVAKSNTGFYLLAWGKNDGSCGLCNNADTYIFNQTSFKEWAKEMKFPLVFIDDCSSSLTDTVWQKYYNSAAVSFPQFLLLDAKKSDKAIGKAQMMGAAMLSTTGRVSASKVDPCAYYMTPFNPGAAANLVNFYLSTRNDTAADAIAVTPGALDATGLTTVGLVGNVGSNSLSCVQCWSGDTYKCHYTSPSDWYSFTADGTHAYQIRLPYYVDSEDQGRICVYDSLSKAKLASVNYAAATNTAYAFDQAPMHTAAEDSGWTFAPVSSGTVYVCFTRPDLPTNYVVAVTNYSSKGEAKITEYQASPAFTLDYTFTLQTVNQGGYYFDDSAVISSRENVPVPVTLRRTNTSVDAVAEVQVAGTERTLSIAFRKGEDSAAVNLDVTADLGLTVDADYWTTNRTVTLAVDNPRGLKLPTGAVAEKTVVITSAQDEFDAADPADDNAGGATVLESGTAARLNSTDTVDWYTFTAEAGRLYQVSNKVTRLRGVDAVDCAVYRGGATGTPINGTRFGGDQDETIYVKVSRAAGTAPVTALYTLTVTSEAMPVIGLASAAQSIASPRADTELTFTVTADRAAPADTAATFNWKTEAGTAVAGTDFTSVPETTAALTTAGTVLTVTATAADCWRPARSFKVCLEPADFKTQFYMLGTTQNCTVTIAADAQGGNSTDDVTPGTWSGVRNVSGTCTGDKLTITNTVKGTYRLVAGDVRIKPAGAATGILVAATSNGKKLLENYPLASLTNVWPMVTLEGDYPCEIGVSRAADTEVFAEYQLRLEPWTVPSLTVTLEGDYAPETLSILDTNEVVRGAVTLSCTNTLDTTVRVQTADGTAKSGEDYETPESTITISAGSTNVTFSVPLIPERSGIYTGDRTFRVTCTAVDEVTAGTYDEVGLSRTVKLVDVDKATDVYDPGDDTRTGATPAPITAAGTVFTKGRLCGADTEDWFAFTNLTAGTAYDFTVNIDTGSLRHVSATNLLAIVWQKDGTAVTNEFLSTQPVIAQGDTLWVQLLRRTTARDGSPASVVYDLTAKAYEYPVYGFTETAATVTDAAETNLVFTLARTGNTNRTDVIHVASTNLVGVSGVDYTALDEDLTFAPGETGKTVSVTVLAGTAGVWDGNGRTFALIATTEDPWVKLDEEAGSVTVTVNDADPEFEDGDSLAESESNPMIKTNLETEASLTFTRTLHGADTNDWFVITSGHKGMSYRVQLTNDVENAHIKKLMVEFVVPGCGTQHYTLEQARKEQRIEAQTGGKVYVRVYRDDTNESDPYASCTYSLILSRWQPTAFSFEQAAYVTDDTNTTLRVTVLREHAEAGNSDTVTVVCSNGTAVAGEAYQAVTRKIHTKDWTDDQFEFDVSLIPELSHIYTGDRDFSLYLQLDDTTTQEFGAASNATVTLHDVDAMLDQHDRADDVKSGATPVTVVRATKAADAARLNGDDTEDWYRLTKIHAGKYYRFGVTNLACSGVSPEEITASIYYDGSETAVTNLTFDALAEGLVKVTTKTVTDEDVHVRVSRPAETEGVVSVAYTLLFREQPPQGLAFETNAVPVSEASDYVYVDVTCTADEPLEMAVTATVTPEENPEDPFSAEPETDFDPTPVTTVWEAGSMGGTQRVGIRLANFDGVYEGDETFLLKLTCEDDSADVDSTAAEMTVTITDKDAPTYGTVGITETGSLTVREGETFAVTLARVDGWGGSVTGLFTWVVGKTTVKQQLELFADREQGTRTIQLEVPAVPAGTLTQSATLTFALVGKGPTLTKGSATKFTLTVLAANYGGSVTTFAADDPTRMAFRAAATAWYAGADGSSLYAVTPAKVGGTSVLTTTVTGPGTLTFDALFTDGEGCTLTVNQGATVLATITDSAERIAVPVTAAGDRTLTFVFTRVAKNSLATASVKIDNLDFTRDTSAQRYGTFNGYALVNGQPGTATMTISANGRCSGRFLCADRTWTFSAGEAWEAELTARATGQTPIAFTLDEKAGVVTAETEDGALTATLWRSPWRDKPLDAAAASAVATFGGQYLTANLRPETDALGTSLYGSGYLGLTVSANGTVKATGMLADGTSAALSGTLGLDTDGTPRTFLFLKPSTYRGGWMYTAPALVTDETGVTVLAEAECPALEELPGWKRNGAVSFERAPALLGGFYDKSANLYDTYVNPLLVTRSDDDSFAGSVRFSASGTKLVVDDYDGSFTTTFNRATGLFGGRMRANGRSYSYRGLLTPNGGEDKVLGRGFFRTGTTNSTDIIIEDL